MQPVQRTGGIAGGLQDMGIDHRRLQTVVPQQQLDGPNVGALPQQVRGKGMPQRMNAGVLENPCLIERRLERLLQA